MWAGGPHTGRTKPLALIKELLTKISTRRSRVSEEEINKFVSKFQSLLLETRQRGVGRASAAKLLKETCNYVRSLNQGVNILSERLSALMATMNNSSAEADLIRSLISS
ncbi:Transcription factor bHLH135 [Musa troglodytarum]|uniref:Transcription factor bHLH135 n=1 Tax=Musa troglodytarum TaxID=320322 RepID=A0A9E7HND3_9LILI|nr:Transcription factor bHLH135 [Musa troglodytarum]